MQAMIAKIKFTCIPKQIIITAGAISSYKERWRFWQTFQTFHAIQASQPQFAWGKIIYLFFTQVTADKHTETEV